MVWMALPRRPSLPLPLIAPDWPACGAVSLAPRCLTFTCSAFVHYHGRGLSPSTLPCGPHVTLSLSVSPMWECGVARSVVNQREAARAVAAAPAPPPGPLALAHVWLARPPPGMHADVWGVVCLAVVEAMAHGMRRLAGMVLRRRDRQLPLLAAAIAAAAAVAAWLAAPSLCAAHFGQLWAAWRWRRCPACSASPCPGPCPCLPGP